MNYIMVKTQENLNISLSDMGSVNQLNQLFLDKKIEQIPITSLLGKDFNYPGKIQNLVEFDGTLFFGNEENSYAIPSGIKPGLNINPNLKFDLVYANALSGVLSEKIKNNQDCHDVLEMLNEYNDVAIRKKDPENANDRVHI